MSSHLMSRIAAATAAIAVFIAPTQTDAQGRTAAGVGANGMSWEAASRIVGVTSTGTIPGGDARYLVPDGTAGGVVGLLMTFANGDQFVCSGTLLADRRSILTAAHCVTDGALVNPVSTQVLFRNTSTSADATQIWFDANVTAVGVTDYFVNGAYTGQVIDQNDIAVLRMGAAAPEFANSFDLFDAGPSGLTGNEFNVMGYGGRSNGGGNIGANLGTGRLRQGDNRFDFRLGDAQFGGDWNGVFGTADVTYSYLSDFDNGLAGNDASCRIADEFFNLAGAKFCNLGVGADEVGVAGGDSGGPQFINGQLAAVTSYGLSYGRTLGDVDNNLNSSFGEFSGYVPTYIHGDFIRGNLVATVVPEPTSIALMGMGLAGLGVVARRRRKTA